MGDLVISGAISLGQLLQAVTLAGSVLGATFAAGGYVQSLRDTIAQSDRARLSENDRLAGLLHELIGQTTAQTVATTSTAAAVTDAASSTAAAVTDAASSTAAAMERYMPKPRVIIAPTAPGVFRGP